MIEILATNCLVTKGYNRSLLCDLHRFKWWAIPNEVASYILAEDFETLKREHQDLYDLLREQDSIIQIPEADRHLFPAFNLDYEIPRQIEQAIIDWDENYSTYNILELVKELKSLDCKHIALRFYSIFDQNILELILNEIKGSTIHTIEILMPYSMFCADSSFFLDLYTKNLRLIEIILHSCSNISLIPIEFKEQDWLKFTKQKIDDCSACGQVSPLYFGLSVPHHALTKNFNNCLYKKIGIDVIGNIKNCPSSNDVLGIVNKDKLSEIIVNSKYKKIGKITKEQIEVCKDCEFRSICSDCRIYVDNPKDMYSRPAKCEYNPYISKWKGEKGFLPVKNTKEP